MSFLCNVYYVMWCVTQEDADKSTGGWAVYSVHVVWCVTQEDADKSVAEPEAVSEKVAVADSNDDNVDDDDDDDLPLKPKKVLHF